MIIPVKCFTCGNVLADLYLYYVKEVRKIKVAQKMTEDEVVYLDEANPFKTAEGQILDKLNMHKMCCRRHMLTHVDIE